MAKNRSERDPHNPQPQREESDEPSKGPSLVLLYSLIALALLLAVAAAAMIVLPFYEHR